MARLVQYIRDHPLLSALTVFTLFIATGALMRLSGECLKTASAPGGIVTFELAFSKEKANLIKMEWDATQCANQRTATEMAVTNTYQDFLFIIGYTSLLVVLTILFSRYRDKIIVRWILLCLVAALFDCVENVFMLMYIDGASTHPSIFGVFASAKFLLVVILLINILIGMVRRALPGPAER